jgi:hypothetical protein
MKTGLFSLIAASVLLGASSIAFAGAVGEPIQPEELPAPAPVPPPAAVEVEEREVIREFAGFLTDAETSNGFWGEIGSVFGRESDAPGTEVDAVNTYAHLSYGQEMWEAGALLPYQYLHEDNGIGNDDGLGDLRLWGKVMPLRTDMFRAGAGLVVSFPTGDDPTFSNDLNRSSRARFRRDRSASEARSATSCSPIPMTASPISTMRSTTISRLSTRSASTS